MKIKKLLVLAPIVVLSLTSCGKTGVRHETSDYFITPTHCKYDSEDGLRILQLSDLHLGTNCDRQVQFKFIEKTIRLANEYVKEETKNNVNKKEKVDMIVITGDVFTFANREIAKSFCDFMEKQQIDWTLTFGNHDEQCYFSVDWLTGYLNELSAKSDSYLVFKDNQDDDVFGNANFVISIPKGTELDQERLYIFDSNRYRYEIGSYGYDYIHYDQIDWYERCARYNFGRNENAEFQPSDVHSLAFFHIPFEEFDTYYKAADKGEGTAHFVKEEGTEKELKTQKEGVSCPKTNTHLYDKFVNLKTTKGVFVGHDHINNSAVETYADAITLSFGVKGTDTVYADDDLIGGQVIHVSGTEINKKIGIRTITHKYSELEEGK